MKTLTSSILALLAFLAGLAVTANAQVSPILNGGFEQPAAGKPASLTTSRSMSDYTSPAANWMMHCNAGCSPTTFSLEQSTCPNGGQNMLHVTAQGGQSGPYQVPTGLSSGTTCGVSCWVKVVSGQVKIAMNSSGQGGSAVSQNHNVWEQLTFMFDGSVTPDMLTIYNQGGSGEFYIDAATVTVLLGGGLCETTCTPVNPNRLAVRREGGLSVVADTINKTVLYSTPHHLMAMRIVQMIKFYGCTRICYADKSDHSLSYGMLNTVGITGAMPGEDCSSFNPTNLMVAQMGGGWKILDGAKTVLEFGQNQKEARNALCLIQMFRFTNICKIGTVTYMRR